MRSGPIRPSHLPIRELAILQTGQVWARILSRRRGWFADTGATAGALAFLHTQAVRMPCAYGAQLMRKALSARMSARMALVRSATRMPRPPAKSRKGVLPWGTGYGFLDPGILMHEMAEPTFESFQFDPKHLPISPTPELELGHDLNDRSLTLVDRWQHRENSPRARVAPHVERPLSMDHPDLWGPPPPEPKPRSLTWRMGSSFRHAAGVELGSARRAVPHLDLMSRWFRLGYDPPFVDRTSSRLQDLLAQWTLSTGLPGRALRRNHERSEEAAAVGRVEAAKPSREGGSA